MISFTADDVYFKQHFCTCNESTCDKKWNAKQQRTLLEHECTTAQGTSFDCCLFVMFYVVYFLSPLVCPTI